MHCEKHDERNDDCELCTIANLEKRLKNAIAVLEGLEIRDIDVLLNKTEMECMGVGMYLAELFKKRFQSIIKDEIKGNEENEGN